MRTTNVILLLLIPSFTAAESLDEIMTTAGINEVKEKHGLSGKDVTVVVHDGFDLAEGERVSHGNMVEAIIRAAAPNANVVNITNIFLKEQFTDARAPSKLVGRFIADKYNPRVINLSWGQSNVQKFLLDYRSDAQRKLIRELARFGLVVVLAAGNEGELAGTNIATDERARFIDEINNDPRIEGGIVLVGAGDVFSPSKREKSAHIKDLIANYSLLAGVSRNHYIVGGPKVTAGTSARPEFDATTGTSFTAPVVSGILSLLAEKFPTASGKSLIRLLLGGATDVRHVFERPEVRQFFIDRLEKTTDHPKSHWRHIQWFDIFGRGVVDAKASVELGERIFARKTLIFPKNADMVVYGSDTSFITQASSIWPLFELWNSRAEANIDKGTAMGRSKAVAAVEESLWPFMKLWVHLDTLPFSAIDKFIDIGILLSRAGDIDFAFDVLFEGLYYATVKGGNVESLEYALNQLSKNIVAVLTKSHRDDYVQQSLTRFRKRHPDFDINDKWPSLIRELESH